jgi:hypothetical protein
MNIQPLTISSRPGQFFIWMDAFFASCEQAIHPELEVTCYNRQRAGMAVL